MTFPGFRVSSTLPKLVDPVHQVADTHDRSLMLSTEWLSDLDHVADVPASGFVEVTTLRCSSTAMQSDELGQAIDVPAVSEPAGLTDPDHAGVAVNGFDE